MAFKMKWHEKLFKGGLFGATGALFGGRDEYIEKKRKIEKGTELQEEETKKKPKITGINRSAFEKNK